MRQMTDDQRKALDYYNRAVEMAGTQAFKDLVASFREDYDACVKVLLEHPAPDLLVLGRVQMLHQVVQQLSAAGDTATALRQQVLDSFQADDSLN